MPLHVQCPHCSDQVKVPPTWSRATCPHCCTTFSAADLRAGAATKQSATAGAGNQGATAATSALTKAVRGPARGAVETDDQDDLSFESVNAWGPIAFVLAALGLVSAPVLGIRMLTMVLSVAALAVTLAGVQATRDKRQSKDRFWLSFSGALGGLTLLITLLAPGLLNSFWAMDFAVPEPDPQLLVVTTRTAPLGEGRSHTSEDAADAEKEVVRQHEMVARVDEVRRGTLPEKGSTSFFLVHVRLGNTGRGAKIDFEGFGLDKHTPTLKDKTGNTYRLVDVRPRKYTAGGPIDFEAGQVKTGTIRILDMQLVFQAPPPQSGPYQLELPAAAWGRQGVCRFRLPESFQFTYEPAAK